LGKVEKGTLALNALASLGSTDWNWTGSTGGNSVGGTTRCGRTVTPLGTGRTCGIIVTIAAGIATSRMATTPRIRRSASDGVLVGESIKFLPVEEARTHQRQIARAQALSAKRPLPKPRRRDLFPRNGSFLYRSAQLSGRKSGTDR
jgi:hypothetical protein